MTNEIARRRIHDVEVDRFRPDAVTTALPEGWVSMQYASNGLGNEYSRFLLGMGATFSRHEGVKTYQYTFPAGRIKTSIAGIVQGDEKGSLTEGPTITLTEPLPNSSTRDYGVELAFGEIIGTHLPGKIDLTVAAVNITEDKTGNKKLVLVTPHLLEGPDRFEVITIKTFMTDGVKTVQVTREVDAQPYAEIVDVLDAKKPEGLL